MAPRQLHFDHRNRLSQIWVPAPPVFLRDAKENEESHAKLVRAGFLRQAHPGVFHLLPLGLRVQDKVEALVDKHMKAIGASRVALSSISSAKLWERSGRLDSVASELFQLSDRKDVKYLLAPTHEEEITELVAQNVRSYRGLPLRLYQITRKYRDEMRPRHGILRSREFLMKDLYTFDASVEDALATYEQVRAAYARIFAELNVPVLAARASSGTMGGNLSHEYHLPASLGEDFVARCSHCGYTANTEVLQETKVNSIAGQTDTVSVPPPPPLAVKRVQVWRGITRDRRTLVSVWYAAEAVDPATGTTVTMADEDIDVHAVQAAGVPDLDASLENPIAAWNEVLAAAAAAVAATGAQLAHDPPQAPASTARPRLLNLVDGRLQRGTGAPPIDPFSWPGGSHYGARNPSPAGLFDIATVVADESGQPLRLSKVRTGDDCPACSAAGALTVERAIELGHTFYLGTRYTDALGVSVPGPSSPTSSSSASTTIVPYMGCYGLGVSRILGAVADHCADARGLNWPRAMAPYEVVVVAGAPLVHAAETVYDVLAEPAPTSDLSSSFRIADVLLDDRPHASLPYKLTDADLTGYPVVVVVGAAWRKSVGTDGGAAGHTEAAAVQHGLCEVQCRQLGVRENVPLRDLRANDCSMHAWLLLAPYLYANRRHITNDEAYRLLTASQSHDSAIGLCFHTVIVDPVRPLSDFVLPLVSPTVQFLVHLRIVPSVYAHFSAVELASLATLPNLGVLEIIELDTNPGICYGPEIEAWEWRLAMAQNRPDPHQVSDWLLGAWATLQQLQLPYQPAAWPFPALRILRLWGCRADMLTEMCLGYVTSFPSLAYFDVRAVRAHQRPPLPFWERVEEIGSAFGWLCQDMAVDVPPQDLHYDLNEAFRHL
ncbi:prolyl-tRNA synthetase [Niveomyces insectorum RCEF 264]|uniref:proline--tRNA ligase n=1 Tax=Niveomyces insectorum RCEF 264 TaxID=1081102 RepID=A0A167SQG2_9HYPO|nr:prolyl-tRNA synthetase [Niveomyces insectorum RCEF 264]